MDVVIKGHNVILKKVLNFGIYFLRWFIINKKISVNIKLKKSCGIT